MIKSTLFKKVLAAVVFLLLLCNVSWAQLPYTFVNNSTYADADVYVAVVGITGGHVWLDCKTSTVRQMSVSDNTVSGPVISGNTGPGANGKYANCFTKLSDIPNKTITIPQIAGCRILISFKSQLYLYFFGYSGAPSGYSAPNLANPVDPNQGVRFEMVELTNGSNGLWTNTTRVDSYQYPMGLEVWGNNGFYKKVGEIKTQDQIIAQWKANAPVEFQGCLNTTQNIIKFPTKNAPFQEGGAYANFFQSYIDAIWSKYTNSDLIFDSGNAGVWKGRVSGNAFVFHRVSDNQIASIFTKPNTQAAMEGSGALATGAQWDLVVQAQICAAINRHCIDLNAASGATQYWNDESKYYQTWPYNYYCKFWHQSDISFNSLTYSFCYDDVWDKSSTINCSSPTKAVITIGSLTNTVAPLTGTTGLNGTYYLQNRNSGLFMDVANNGDPADGTNILQWTGTGGTNQQFTITDNGSGIYKLICVKTGKCVDIDGISTASGANVHQWSYVGGDNQQFALKATDNGYYKLIAKHSRKLIEVGNAGKNAGDNINQWDDNGQTCGQWKLVPVSTPSTKIEAEAYSTMAGVQTEACTEGGSNVGYIDANDWMAYNNVNFPVTGTYTFEFRVASVSGATLSGDLNAGSIQLGTATIPATGGWQNWTTVKFSATVNAGTYNLGVFAKTGGWNFNWIQITQGLKSASLESSIEIAPLSATLSIYPNPVENLLTIAGGVEGQFNVKVINMNGVLVMDQAVENLSTLDVSALQSGVYILQAVIDNKVQTVRFIKK